MRFDEPADGFPLGRRDFCRRGAIGDDLHVAIGHQYIDEHTVAKFGVPDAKLGKNLHGALSRRDPGPQRTDSKRRFHRESDFTGTALFRGPNGGFDARVDRIGKPSTRPGARGTQMADRADDGHS
jgi:hypothetical protein